MRMTPDPEILRALGVCPEIILPLLATPVGVAVAAAQAEQPGLTDIEFEHIAHALPPEPRQNGALPNRDVIDALLWQVRNRKVGTQLPARLGSAEALRKKVERWSVSCVFDRLLVELDRVGDAISWSADLRKIALGHMRRGQRIRKFRGTES